MTNKMRDVLQKISTLAKEGKEHDALEQFIDSLIEERGFPQLTEDVRDVIKKDISNKLDDFIGSRVIAKLSDEDLLTFEKLLKEKKSQEEIQKFVSTHIPEFVDFLTDTLLEFRSVYLGLMDVPSVEIPDIIPAPAILKKPN